MMDTVHVQLAQPHKTRAPYVVDALHSLIVEGGYLFDLKWDGVRCVAFCDNGAVTLINRKQRDITFRYPDLVAALAREFEDTKAVLDGEIVCFGDDGKPDFARVHRRDAQQGTAKVGPLLLSSPATYVAFDLLRWQDDDLRPYPFQARRALLETLGSDWRASLLVSQVSDDGQLMWDFIKREGMEGLIAKPATSPYRAGRNTWIKLKPTSTVTAVVNGYDPGEGARARTFGALHISLLDGSTIVPIGKVGSGFTDKDLALVLERLAGTEPLVIEVEYQDVSPAKVLRFPVFKGIRDDQTIFDCTFDQIEVPKHEWSH